MPLPAHILARPEEIAEVAVTCGDPARTEQLAKMLRAPKLVNSNRGFITYTGHYGKRRMTIATHGIGGPSAAIVFEELHMLGANTIVRFGTGGALVRGLNVGDFLVPTGAAYSGGSVLAYGMGPLLPAVPDPTITRTLIRACSKAGLNARQGLVFSSDAFYAQEGESLRPRIKGALAIEMECATLFTLGRLRKFRAGALLMVSNSLVKKSEARLVDAQRLRPFVEKGAQAVFEALAEL